MENEIIVAEAPRLLKLEDEPHWHIRDTTAASVAQPLCPVRYEHARPEEVIGVDEPVYETLCPACCDVYLRDVADQPELTASIMVSRTFSQHLVDNPMYARHLAECYESKTGFNILQNYVYSVSTFLARENEIHLVLPISRYMVDEHVPTDAEVLACVLYANTYDN